VYSVVLANDDGPHSEGLLELARKLDKKYDLTVVVPDAQRSATGKALTISRPLRVTRREREDGLKFIIHDGSPADSVILAQSFIKKIDLCVAGINSGANTGYQSMFTSGTVGIILESALQGIPGIAVSKVVDPSEWFCDTTTGMDYTRECDTTLDIASKVLEKGMPENIDAINVNFPLNTTLESRLVVTKPTRVRMSNELEKRIDPNEAPYYWIRGIENNHPIGTDAYEVIKNGNVAISPIIIESASEAEIDQLKQFIDS
jgi:5'-nucleotidase